ncbi:MAG: AAA family ATPase, partial [Candidatus Aminicenantaceae bacterium]
MKPFTRKFISQLNKWTHSENRKPLILRGARQVGKTTAVNIFSKQFDQYIYLNLEKRDDADLFRRNLKIKELLQAIFLYKNITQKKGRLLLFIDEIQNSPEAVSALRYFYEELQDIFVIAAGSLFEVMLESKQISFPVGRVQFFFIYPLTFEEFLEVMREYNALELLDNLPLPEYGFPKLFKLFHTYTLIGGMPEIIDKYRQIENISDLTPIFQSLLTGYIDDVSKYARNETMRNIIKHCIESAPLEAGKRISFAGFGTSSYRSREVGEALKNLERAMLLYLLYPTKTTKIPITTDKKKSPRLQFFDTGILNYVNGLQAYFFKFDDLHSFYKGLLAEHIVGQELLASDISISRKPIFWVREKKQSSAEVDFVFQFDRYVIPLEIKAGKSGTLRSLHQFMNRCDHIYAVRMYSGPVSIEKAKTPEGKLFYLLNLPHFLTGKIKDYMEWFLEKIGR